MSAFVGAFIIVAFLLFFGYLIHVTCRDDKPRVTRPDRLTAEAVRLLDQALVDPVFRQSKEWEDKATRLVENYYRKELNK